jgi:NAD(P)-dependent dehydrogenase (short-subunit alcohol dehydrogenase family)
VLVREFRHVRAWRDVHVDAASGGDAESLRDGRQAGAIETPINAKLLHDPVKLAALTRQIPLARLGKPADVAGLAVFPASSDSDYVTGSTYFVDGGLTVFYQER